MAEAGKWPGISTDGKGCDPEHGVKRLTPSLTLMGTNMTDRMTVGLSVFTIAVSAFLMTAMFATAFRHDCRVPPKQVSLTAALVMEWVCPDSLDRIGR